MLTWIVCVVVLGGYFEWNLISTPFQVSPYSYFAIIYLIKNREILKQYGVEVE
jgi:hypothetical protein